MKRIKTYREESTNKQKFVVPEYDTMLNDLAELLDSYIEELDKLTEVVKAQAERIKELENKLNN